MVRIKCWEKVAKMPHQIEKSGSGWKVCDKPARGKPKKCYSKKPMSWEAAHRQFVAINLSLARKGEKVSWEGSAKPGKRKN